MRAIVDQDTCIGCGLCVQICPEVFRMEDDKAIAYAATVPETVMEKVEDAANQCPVAAITVEG